MTTSNDLRYLADVDASWSLPHHSAPSSSSSSSSLYNNKRQQLQNNRSLDNSIGGSGSGSTAMVFPKQVFHGLAGLLVFTLCILLVELNSPGVATRIGNNLFGSKASLTMKSSRQNYYSPVPSPFIAPKSARVSMASLQEIAPTSEPTVVTSMDMQGMSAYKNPYILFIHLTFSI